MVFLGRKKGKENYIGSPSFYIRLFMFVIGVANRSGLVRFGTEPRRFISSVQKLNLSYRKFGLVRYLHQTVRFRFGSYEPFQYNWSLFSCFLIFS